MYTVDVTSLSKNPLAVAEELQNHQKARSLGFVLQHQYSFDGADTLPLDRLRGRDLLLVDIFQALIEEWRHSTSV